ncbi:tRNA lysidine(34) synthetase [Promicromonospora panici]|uniref:tRNA lysidine(34) synthetase n=1 Tax=Promicromonospora panici TaxID=2219658 RepID=UPI00101C1F13|nr:tRNA lysidine(34) synthetase [Promicromonospora panici]
MARVDPAVAAARNAVRAVVAGLGPDDLVLVACSGGADSLALAASAAFEARQVGRSVRSRGYAVRAGAVIVDHGLQPGSAEVAERAAEQCRALGLDPVLVRRAVWPGRAGAESVAVERRTGRGKSAHKATRPTFDKVGPEAAARDARYGALEAVAEETGAALVLLGHTLDDQAEQVLLGLARGAGARSLAGMPRERGIFRRPFLGLRRAQTEAVCKASGLEFWTDPTNLLPDAAAPASDRGEFTPLRSLVRGRVLPVLEETLGPGVAEALGRSADQLRDDADLLDTLAAELLERAREVVAAGEPDPEHVLDAGVLERAHPALRRRALRLAALAVGCPPSDTTTRHVDALDALVVSWSGQGTAHLPGGARARRVYGRLFLRAAPNGLPGGETGVRPPSTTQE